MRMRFNKFVYIPVGGALGAGLLVSAFVVPTPKLAAAQDCYSACNSTTSLSLSTSSLVVGHEEVEKFSVTVTGDAFGTAKPTGTVEIEADGKGVCGFALSDGKGSCSLGDKQLGGGSYEIDAHYNGDDDLSPSTSAKKHLEVIKGDSKTYLTLSRSSLIVGHEEVEKFTVKVTADDYLVGTPAGSVDIESDGKTLCSFALSDGKGSCSLGYRQLGGGSYVVDAHYNGDDVLEPSTSGKLRFDVIKGDSKTDLTLSKSTVTDGKESDEKFTVKVTADDSLIGTAAGPVDIVSDGKTLCHFDLSHGEGHCSLDNSQLKAGSYEIEAHYLGDDVLDPSTSGKVHLTVDKS